MLGTPPLRWAALALLVLPALATLRGAGDGETAPCRAPLVWRVASVDPGFDLGHPEAVEAARTAAEIWNRAAGRILLEYDARKGFPIHLIHDRRQADFQARSERLAELEPLAESLRKREEELQRRRDLLAGEGLRLEREAREMLDRRADHDREVAGWNRSRSVHPEVRARLTREGNGLQTWARELQERREEFDRRRVALLAEVDDLKADIDDHNRAVLEVEGDFSAGIVESGRFVGRTRGGRLVGREIRVFRFTSPEELVLVLAHEFGHALGMGHSRERGWAIMSEVGHGAPGDGETPAPGAGDLALLAELCPGVARGTALE